MRHSTILITNPTLTAPPSRGHNANVAIQAQVCACRALDLEPLPCFVLQLSRYCRHPEQAALALPRRHAHCDTLLGSMMTDPQLDILSAAVGRPNPVLIKICVDLRLALISAIAIQGFPFAPTWRSLDCFGVAELPATFGIAETPDDGSTKFCAGVGPPRQVKRIAEMSHVRVFIAADIPIVTTRKFAANPPPTWAGCFSISRGESKRLVNRIRTGTH